MFSQPLPPVHRDEDEGSIILSLISQLRVGMDLSKVTFPTFVLEPRSMLERITDFMAHPDLIFGADLCEDPEDRFIRVLQYYLAGWHIKPKGVKKPLAIHHHPLHLVSPSPPSHVLAFAT